MPSNIPGIDLDDVVIHAAGGEMQVSIDWQEDRPATATAVYRCPWGSVVPLMKALRGGYADGDGGGLAFPKAPHAFPLIPELYCCGVSVGPKDDEVRKDLEARQGEDDYPFNYHPHALVTASYRAPDWAFDAAQANEANQIDPGNPILGCRQRVRASTAFLVFEGAKLKWAGTSDTFDAPDGIPANQVEIVLEYPRLRRNPTEFLNEFKGRVNSHTMWFLPPEHVYFDNFEVDSTYTLDGIECSAVLTFLGSIDLSWNERLNDEGEPQEVVFVNSDPERKPFQSIDLRAIF